jgi:uncharacterized RDD family membrane protein YckC
MDFQSQKKIKLQEKLALEPAPILIRILAFGLDFLLLSAVTTLLFGKWLLPMYYSSEWTNFINQMIDYMNNSDMKSFGALSDEKLRPMLVFIQAVSLILWGAYFTLSDIFMLGSSLGKRVFSLQVIQADVNELPSAYTSVLRGLFKSIFILAYIPILLADALFMFFNPEKRAGHDWLCRTRVVFGSIPAEKKEEARQAEEDAFF